VSAQREGQNARAVYMMGLVAARCGSEARASDLYRRALEVYRSRVDAEDELSRLHEKLAELYEAWGRRDAAREHRARAVPEIK